MYVANPVRRFIGYTVLFSEVWYCTWRVYCANKGLAVLFNLPLRPLKDEKSPLPLTLSPLNLRCVSHRLCRSVNHWLSSNVVFPDTLWTVALHLRGKARSANEVGKEIFFHAAQSGDLIQSSHRKEAIRKNSSINPENNCRQTFKSYEFVILFCENVYEYRKMF